MPSCKAKTRLGPGSAQLRRQSSGLLSRYGRAFHTVVVLGPSVGRDFVVGLSLLEGAQTTYFIPRRSPNPHSGRLDHRRQIAHAGQIGRLAAILLKSYSMFRSPSIANKLQLFLSNYEVGIYSLLIFLRLVSAARA